MDDHGFALALAEQGPTYRRLVGDPTLAWAGLSGADDGEGFLAVGAVNVNRGADLDVIRAEMPVDDDGVLDERLEPLNLPLDEGLLVLGVFVLGIFGQVAVFLGIVDPLRDLRAPNVGQLLQLRAKLDQVVFRDVLSLVIHRGAAPILVRPAEPVGYPAPCDPG